MPDGCVDVALAQPAFFLQLLGDRLVLHRLHETEGQIFQLPLQLPDAQTVGQRRMDVEGQVRQSQSFRIRPCHGLPHLHQLPGQQDDQHTQVEDDGKQQTTQAFGAAHASMLLVDFPDLSGCVQSVQQARLFGFQFGVRRQHLRA